MSTPAGVPPPPPAPRRVAARLLAFPLGPRRVADRPRSAGGPAAHPRPHRVAAGLGTALAGLLVFTALVAPSEIGQLRPGAFVRVPIEAILAVGVLLALTGRTRRVVATVAGVVLGLLAGLKLLDMGFHAVLARPFDPVLDWVLIPPAVEFLATSSGRGTAVGIAVAAVGLAVALPVLTALSVRQLARVVVAHRGVATRVATALAAVWITCALLGAQLVAGVPVASADTAGLVGDRAVAVGAGLRDQRTFAAEAAADAHRDIPSAELLAGLRDKDVVIAFVESYGRSAASDPEIAAVLDDGERRLAGAGFAARSGFLTSPVVGGRSWLAHATLHSGLWIDNDQRLDRLVAGDRMTLTSAFRKTGHRTVAVMPGTTRDWPEAEFYGYDQVYDARNLGYRGPMYGWATMPDQYTWSAFERLERGRADRAPVLAEIALVSSHAPWAPSPPLLGWDQVGDGSGFAPTTGAVAPSVIDVTDPDLVRADYLRSVAYSLDTLVSYVQTYGDDDLVLVVLGDHQPVPMATGGDAGADVPVTVLARDPAVLDRIAGWGWDEGVAPGPAAPVWRMDAFRDRFLAAFGPP